MKIPAFDLSRQTRALKTDFMTAIENVVDSGAYILGKQVQAFETAAAEFFKVKHAVGCASGTEALQLVLMAGEFSEGDEIITTPFTFVATADVISLLKLKPVFVDIDPDTHNIDVKSVVKAVTERTKAILPVHLFGRCLDINHLRKAIASNDIWIIEDCAQSFGAELNGFMAGTMGDAGCFSFYPTKNLGGFGDGGLVITNDDGLAEKLLALRGHGQKRRYTSDFIGLNSRLDAMQAAILRKKLPHVPDWNQKRRAIAARYNDGLKDMPVKVPDFDFDEFSHVFHQYSIEAEKRDELQAYLTENEIGTVIYYPVPLHLQAAFSYLGYRQGDLPNVEKACGSILSLPMFPELSNEETDRVINVIRKFYTNKE